MFGFVKSPGFPPWPSALLGESGGRMKVSFFGTSRIALVKKKEWIPYTADQLEKADTLRNARRSGAFKAGLKELRDALNGDGEFENKQTTQEKKNVTDKKDNKKKGGLRKQQMENERTFNSVMRKLSTRQWRCNRCKFSTGFKYRAKTHSVLCSSMLRVRKKRTRVFTCLSCPEKNTFSSKKLLRVHTRQVHPQVFLCVDHPQPVSFTLRWNLMRHLKEKHPVGRLQTYSCPDCALTSKRKYCIDRHIKRKHPRRHQINEMMAELIYDAVQRTEKLNENVQTVDRVLDDILSKVVQENENQKSLQIANPKVTIGMEFSDYEKQRQERMNELSEKFKVIFAEEYEARRICEEEKEKQRIERAALKHANKLRREEAGPTRKSLRLGINSIKETFSDNSNRKKECDVDTIKNTGDKDVVLSDLVEAPSDMEFNHVKASGDGVSQISLDGDEDTVQNMGDEDVVVSETIKAPSDMEFDYAKASGDSVSQISLDDPDLIEIEDKENIDPKKKLKCEKHYKCTFRARDNYGLKNHYRAKHELIETTCSKSFCNLVFNTLFEKELHIKSCSITCTICGKSFKRGDKWESHQRFETSRANKLSL